MKAKEIIDNIQKEHSMGPYEYLMFDECVHAMKEYARIQIEKDRQKISEEFINQGLVGCSDIINEMPIALK